MLCLPSPSIPVWLIMMAATWLENGLFDRGVVWVVGRTFAGDVAIP